MNEQKPQNILSIPVAIVVAGAFIAGAVIYTSSPKIARIDAKNSTANIIDVLPVDENDHILGNPNAPIVFVEYSDTECPFCKNFHATMHKLIDTYGKDGKIAWAYRHMPITGLHPKAWNEAVSAECAFTVTKNPNIFWKYLDKIYEITPSNNRLDSQKLIDIASDFKIDLNKFSACTTDKNSETKVKKDYDNGLKISQNRPGTPTTVIILQASLEKTKLDSLKNIVTNAGLTEYVIFSDDNQKIIIKGAFPYEVLSLMTELFLQ